MIKKMKRQSSDPEDWLKDLSEENLRANPRNKTYIIKSATAIDYSEISELADDLEDDILSSSPRSQLEGGTTHQTSENVGTHVVAFQNLNVTLPSTSRISKREGLVDVDENRSIICHEAQRRSPPGSLLCSSQLRDSQKVDKPLAQHMPCKYKHVDVEKLFPGFRHGKPLRFLKLFGPGKPSNLPQIYRNFKSRRRNKHSKTRAEAVTEEANASNDNLYVNANASKDWTHYTSDSSPPPGMIEADEGKIKKRSIIMDNNTESEEFMKFDNNIDYSDYDELELSNASYNSNNDTITNDKSTFSDDESMLSIEDNMVNQDDSMPSAVDGTINNDDDDIVLCKDTVSEEANVLSKSRKMGRGHLENGSPCKSNDKNVKYIKHIFEDEELKDAVFSISQTSKTDDFKVANSYCKQVTFP